MGRGASRGLSRFRFTFRTIFVSIRAMLKIRLQRVGRVHEPSYRLVLTQSQNSTKSGRFIEILGNYDSRKGEKSEFKTDRINYWIGKGAQISTTVHNLLIDKKVLSGKKVNALPKKKPIKNDQPDMPAQAEAEPAPGVVEAQPTSETPPEEAQAESPEEVAEPTA